MRRTCSPSRALAALLLLVTTTACPDEPSPKDTATEGTTAKDTSTKPAAEKKRPPFPNMATAAWGSHVMEQLDGAQKPGGLKAQLESSLQALHSFDEGAAASLVKSAASIFHGAENDGDRAMGAALAAVGLALDPRVDGYKERLTDAHGLAAFAATFEGGTAVAQAARAYVAVTAGRTYEGQKLIDVMSTSTRVDGDSALLLAMARSTLGQRDDELIAQARLALTHRPESARARALLARSYLDLGLADEALRVLTENQETLGEKLAAPALVALRGRAEIAAGDVDGGAKTLAGVLPTLSPSEHGEASYWLARALAPRGGEAEQQASAIQTKLAQTPGFASEASLLDVLLADARGDASEAREKSLKLCKARSLPFAVALDCLWTTTEACAEAGDAACVNEWGMKAVGSDDDFARLARARAVLAGRGAPRDGGTSETAALGDEEKAQLKEAHLLSPFDAELGKRLGLPVTKGGERSARLLRGARRALAFDATKAAEQALAALVKTDTSCRVCRALLASAVENGEEAAARAAAALEGAGPPLAERDLIELVDVLGGSGSDVAVKALAKLSSDERATVRDAVKTAQKDQQNPEARAARKAKEAEKAPRPGTVPVPSSTDHGDHK